MNDIKVLPPRPCACRICAAQHRPEEPHELESLYYQVMFYRKHRRFPTEQDAKDRVPPAAPKQE